MGPFAGFEHAAYTFGYQSLVHKHTVRDKDIPPGALILIVQKGLQFIELETNLDKVRFLYGLYFP